MKKKIAIITKKMIIGGIEKSLLSMLQDIDFNKYEVTIFLEEEGGEFEKNIPKWVKVRCIYKNEKSIRYKIIDSLKTVKLAEAIDLIKSGLGIYFVKQEYKNYKGKCSTLPIIDDMYDIAISYHNPVSFSTIYTIEKIKARKKVMWIHSNTDEYINEIDKFKDYYSKYDNIFAVSEGALLAFINKYKELESKTQVYYNRIVKSDITNSCKDEKADYDGYAGVKILTIARISEEKGIDFIPRVTKKLVEDGYDLRWYHIGDGRKEKICSLIDECEVNNYFKLLGSTKKPYKFIKDCDIYVQPSRFEGYVTTVTEAKCFEKPIVATNISGIREQIKNNENGLLVDVNDEAIYLGVKKLLDDMNLRKKLSNNLAHENIDTRSEINKLYELIE